MSDDATDIPTLDDNPDLRVIREKAGRTDQVETENADLRKQLLFVEAGLDRKSELGKLLYETTDASTVEQLKARAIAIGLLQAPPDTQHEDDASLQRAREGLAGGQVPATDPGPDPWEVGWAKFKADGDNGVPLDERRVDLWLGIFGAAARGDKRVFVDKAAHAARAAKADGLAMV